MPKRGDVHSGELEFVRAFTDTMREIKLRGGYELEVRVSDSGQRGVIVLTFAALVLDDSEKATQVAGYAVNWPNSMCMSLPAALYKGSNGLYRLLDQWESDKGNEALLAVVRASAQDVK